MAFYRDKVLPRLTDLVMRRGDLVPYRRRIVSIASGRVLEIGIGSGLNLPLYGQAVDQIIGIDPSANLLEMARKARSHGGAPLQLIEGSAERIPIEDASVDTVVTTWTLCSIETVDLALVEMRRVLKPGGRMLFVEHGLAPDPRVRWWQDRLTPMWKSLSGGCHLNRAISNLIEDQGFRIDRIEKGYLRGPNPMSFIYEGSARPN
jgi:ubiquinone/menaquinone biosynthesis C-methylase UbiE